MLIERQCSVCQKWFQASRSHARFCSTRCRSAFHNQKRLNVSSGAGVLVQLVMNAEQLGLMNDRLIELIISLLRSGVSLPPEIEKQLSDFLK